MKRSTVAVFLMAFSVGNVSVAQQVEPATPISVGIVLDTSGSMREKMDLTRQVLSELLKDGNLPDEVALIEASDEPLVLTEFGRDADRLLAYGRPAETRGGSALMDGVHLGVQVTSLGRNERKVLLLISDGGDNGSSYTALEVENAIRGAGIRMLVVGVGTPIVEENEALRELAGRASLGQMAENVGGRHFDLQYSLDVSRIVAELGAAMRASAL
ncbi:MAG: VWA domain-containing protein [Acidobacteria bacterium]|nr:VWA domain-containing protein [Acidobacteriota bacterium]MDA1234694.1 VWA domain-containing protein [Acidobacteriota bacterium]